MKMCPVEPACHCTEPVTGACEMRILCQENEPLAHYCLWGVTALKIGKITLNDMNFNIIRDPDWT